MQAFNWKEESTQEKEVTHDLVHAGVLRPLSRVPSPHGLARADGNSRPLPLPHFDILYSPQFSSALKIKKWRLKGILNAHPKNTAALDWGWCALTLLFTVRDCPHVYSIKTTIFSLLPAQAFYSCSYYNCSTWNYAEISDSLQPSKCFIQIPGFYHAIRAKARDIYCFFHNAFSFQNSISRFGLNYHCIFQCKA